MPLFLMLYIKKALYFQIYVIFNKVFQVQHGLGDPSTDHNPHTPQRLST